MLVVGLTTEAVIFFFSAFEKPAVELIGHWSTQNWRRAWMMKKERDPI